MYILGHLGITLGIFFIIRYLTRRPINYWYVALGAVLPDIIDKPIGRIIFADSIASGRLIAHTLVFAFFLGLAGLYFYRRRRDARLLLVSCASFLHLAEDLMWRQPVNLFWPLLGWSFPHGAAYESWLDYFIIMFRNWHSPHFSYDFISEIIGSVILFVFIIEYIFFRERS